MAFKKKLSPAARAASVMKAISSAEKSAMQAVAGWGKTTEKALSASEKNLAAASKRAGRMKTRATNALKRVQRAKAKEVKAIASDARKLVQTELASARATLKAARIGHLAHVGLDSYCFSTFALNTRDDLLGLLIALIVVHHDNGAVFGQSLRNRSADSIGSPGHNRHFPTQRPHLLDSSMTLLSQGNSPLSGKRPL
jgi:hypothetical protein